MAQNPFNKGYDANNLDNWLDQDDMFPLASPPNNMDYFEKPNYDPDQILSRLISPTMIQEKTNLRGVGTMTYKEFEGFWKDCGDSKTWKDRPPTWGKGRNVCELIEVPVMSDETDSAITFLYKVCKFPAADKDSGVYPTKQGSSFNPDDAMDLCVMAKGFLAEHQGNRQELVGTFQDLDVEPKASKQRPAIMFYGVGTVDSTKISYPGFTKDFKADQMKGEMDKCRDAKTARDNTVKQTLSALKEDVAAAIHTGNVIPPQNTKPIEEANRRVAQACFPEFNRKSKDAKSLALDTVAGNIVQLAALPVTDTDEIRDFINDPINEALKGKPETYPVELISDTRCKHSRQIAWQMCTNLPSAFLSKAIQPTLNACGDTTTTVRYYMGDILPGSVAQTNWLDIFNKKIDDIKPRSDFYSQACNDAKSEIKEIARNVHDRIAVNPALGVNGQSCAVLSGPLACGMLDTSVPIPDLPSMDETVEQMVKYKAYEGLLGRLNTFNCANPSNKDENAYNVACDPLTQNQSILSDKTVLDTLMKNYGITGDPDGFCKNEYNDPDRRNRCRVLGKIVPDVCGGVKPKETAQTWCSTFRK